MEKTVNEYKTQNTIGGGRANTIQSDDYIRDKHIDNIDTLRNGDGKIADIMRLGNEAVIHTRNAQKDLHDQRQIVDHFYFYDK